MEESRGSGPLHPIFVIFVLKLAVLLAAGAAAGQDISIAPLSIGPVSEAPAPATEAPAMASGLIPADRLQQYSDLALSWMQEYLRIDTTKPSRP